MTTRYWQSLFIYVKVPLKSKYQVLINGRGKVGIKKLKNPNAFINYSQSNWQCL